MNALWAVQGGSGNHLHNFANLIVVYLDLPEGRWVVFGKGLISNYDGDSQSATVALDFEGHPPKILDKLDFILPELGDVSDEAFSLQGAVDANEAKGRTVRLVASTYKGYIRSCSIIAIPVDGFVKSFTDPYPA
jgi:hypothetical protein